MHFDTDFHEGGEDQTGCRDGGDDAGDKFAVKGLPESSPAIADEGADKDRGDN